MDPKSNIIDIFSVNIKMPIGLSNCSAIFPDEITKKIGNVYCFISNVVPRFYTLYEQDLQLISNVGSIISGYFYEDDFFSNLGFYSNFNIIGYNDVGKIKTIEGVSIKRNTRIDKYTYYSFLAKKIS